jgi:hypothetical protein
VVEIGFDAMAAALPDGDAEVVVIARVGGYVTRGERIAELRAPGAGEEAARAAADAIGRAFAIQRARNIEGDPSYGVEQLTNIGWTTMSGAKQNPMPGTNAVNALRDLLLRFAGEGEGPDPETSPGKGAGPGNGPDLLPIVYRQSMVLEVLDGLEELGLICCKSLQGQNLAVILRTLALAHPRLARDARRQAARISMGFLSAMEPWQPREALALRTGLDQLSRSVGQLASRSSRIQAGGAPGS